MAALVSRTSRTTGFRAIGVDLGLDLLGRRRRKRIRCERGACVRKRLEPLGEQSSPHHVFYGCWLQQIGLPRLLGERIRKHDLEVEACVGRASVIP